MTYPDWMSDALCVGIGPEMFFPSKGVAPKRTKAVCARCPVRIKCLDWALENETDETGTHSSGGFFGIYGGLTGNERARLVRARRNGGAA